MKFPDIFIKRPVWAVVISALILILGLRSISSLPVAQWPRTENAIVTITTSYYGADAATIAGFITQPLESAIAQAQGIDYLSSSSVSGVSTITATLRLNYDATTALTEINTQVTSVRNPLPAQAQQPVLSVAAGQTTDAMYIGFFSDVLPANNITDYLVSGRKTPLRFDRGRANSRDSGRAPVRPARLIGSGQVGGPQSFRAGMSMPRCRTTTIYLRSVRPKARWSPWI
jgi:multidrug efflux pump